MTKFNLKVFIKASYELILVFLQFFIIFLHFFQLELIPNKQIIQINNISYLKSFLKKERKTTSVALVGPGAGNNSKTMKFTEEILKHIRYVFLTKLSIYHLCLTITLALLIKFKIILEEQYLKNKFKNYFLYKNVVKY